MALGIEALGYAAASARVRGLRAGLLSEQEWENLTTAQGVHPALTLLQDTAYADALQDLAGQQSALEGVERRLIGLVAENCHKSLALLRGPSRALLQVWWSHFELENLKAIFRGVDQGLGAAQIRAYQIPLSGHSTLDWETLIHESTIPGLIERLDGTHYINPVRNAYHLYTRYGTLFPLEVAVDVRYYRDIAAAIGHLGASERSVASRILGSYVDILNILWAYRYRVYYGLSAEETVNFTLWHTMHTDVSLIQAIALGQEPRVTVEQIWGPDAVDLTGLDRAQSEADQIPILELRLQQYWRDLAQRASNGFPFGLGLVLGYVVLQELEVVDLITVLEGKRLGWTHERIRQHLIRVPAMAA